MNNNTAFDSSEKKWHFHFRASSSTNATCLPIGEATGQATQTRVGQVCGSEDKDGFT